MIYQIFCPHCGEPNEIFVDLSGGSTQEYVEDCQVCCSPWAVRVTIDNEGELHVDVEQS
jgi:hypothetical protein